MNSHPLILCKVEYNNKSSWLRFAHETIRNQYAYCFVFCISRIKFTYFKSNDGLPF